MDGAPDDPVCLPASQLLGAPQRSPRGVGLLSSLFERRPARGADLGGLGVVLQPKGHAAEVLWARQGVVSHKTAVWWC